MIDGRRIGRMRVTRSVVETLEERALFAVGGVEQEFVWLLNRARSNPQAYAAEVGLGSLLNDVVARGPLAVNDNLSNAADVRSGEMATHNYFGHQSAVTGLWPNKVARNAGYALPASFQIGQYTYPIADNSNQIESIAAGYSTAASALRGLIEDAGVPGAGHRVHLMGMDEFNSYNREIGVGYAYNGAATYDHYWTAHATRQNHTDTFVTGVIFNDVDGDERYDAGEGLSGVTVVVGSWAVMTNDAGGYSVKVPAGTHAMMVFGGASGTTARPSVTVGADNVEVDLIANGAAYVNFQKWGNTRPTLDAASPALPIVPFNHTNPPWVRVSDVLGNTFHDVNAGTQPGIAITGGTGGGAWQVWMDGNATWSNVSGVSDTNALLVRGGDWIRFLPNNGWSGTATVAYRAWDRSDGKTVMQYADTTAGGTSGAYSVEKQTASAPVSGANTAPVINPAFDRVVPSAPTGSPTVSTVGSLLTGGVTDADAGAVRGMAVTGIFQPGSGTWQYMLGGTSAWQNFPSLSPYAALQLRAQDSIRYVPAAGWTGNTSLIFRAWDQTTGSAGALADLSNTAWYGGTTAFSADVDMIDHTVTAATVEPVLPGVTITDADVAEGNAGVAKLRFAVTLSAPSAVDVTVPYTLAGGTAIAGKDYVDAGGVVVIPAGETVGHVIVDVLGDTLYETAETLSVNLGTPTGATLGATASAVGTITNDDARPMPEIRVFGMVLSKYVEYADGKNTMNFGSTTLGSAGVVRTFKVHNAGAGVLYLTKLVLPAGFVVVDPMRALLLPGQSDVIKVKMLANAVGTKAGVMRIHTTDADERIFDVNLTGTVKPSLAKAAARASTMKLAPKSMFSTRRIARVVGV